MPCVDGQSTGGVDTNGADDADTDSIAADIGSASRVLFLSTMMLIQRQLQLQHCLR